MKNAPSASHSKRTHLLLSAILAVSAILSLGACATSLPGGPASAYPESPRVAASYPDARFMVLSDVHLYDTSLGTSGAAWDAYTGREQKLLKESPEILAVALEAIRAEAPDFVLVTGDLTKDGERLSHERMSAALAELNREGIKTFVLPGNHDINNPMSMRFLPSGESERTPNINPGEFAEIYSGSGYGDALYRDPSSLSYVAQPVPGLWLLALDSAKYEYKPSRKWPETSGAIRKSTYVWIEDRLTEAREKGVAVIAAEHHPLLEHADGMKERYPAFIVDDGGKLASLLAEYGVRTIFTGHFHANSVVQRAWGRDAPTRLRGKHIVDIETGALSTWPCSYRSVRLSGRDGSMTISTSRVSRLPSFDASGESFEEAGKRAIETGLGNMASSIMRKVGATRRDVEILVPSIVAAMMAHYAGDAHFNGEDFLPRKGLSPIGKLGRAYYARFIGGLWKRTSPEGVLLMADNDLTIYPDGSWRANSE